MEDIRRVYPGLDESDGGFYGPGDYNPLLESMGYQILIKKDEGGYQGDSFVLFYDESGDHGEYDGMDQYGILVFGWGSCSGCDALQACNYYKDIEKLRDELNDSIRWDSASSQLRYFQEHDWDGDWSRDSQECKEWVAESIDYLFKVVS